MRAQEEAASELECVSRFGGKAGRTVQIEQAKLGVSDVRGQVVAGAGHWLMEETPGTVVLAISDFAC